MPTPFEAGEAITRRDRSAAEEAIARGVLYNALALAFRPPEPGTIGRFTAADEVAALADAAGALEKAGGSGMVAAVLELRAEVPSLEELAAEHRRLFGHTLRGAVTPYETEYGNEAVFQQPQELSDLAGIVAAFGLQLRAGARERLDHVSCECEFASFLSCKEAYAIHTGDEEMLAATRGGIRALLRDHLGRFAPTFARQLRRATRVRFYRAMGDLLLACVRYHCARLGICAGPEFLPLRPDPALCAAPLGCGAECEDRGDAL